MGWTDLYYTLKLDPTQLHREKLATPTGGGVGSGGLGEGDTEMGFLLSSVGALSWACPSNTAGLSSLTHNVSLLNQIV